MVNAASYAQPISPGAIVSIFGTNLASTTGNGTGRSASDRTRRYIQSRSTGQKLRCSSSPRAKSTFKFRGQFNGCTSTTRKRQSSSQRWPGPVLPVQVPVYQSGPSLFSQDGSGCGQAAALNIGPDGSVSVNSPSNSAAPGDYISLYGTGFGLPLTLPPDGTAPGNTNPLQTAPGIVFDNSLLPYFAYAGLAPTLVGVDQINIQIPPGTRESWLFPCRSVRLPLGPTLSISIHSGRGQCVDPSKQSYGIITLTKTTTSVATARPTPTFLHATFPSGPGATTPQPSASSPGHFTNLFSPMSRSCPLNGAAKLSAGILSVEATERDRQIAAQLIPAVEGVEISTDVYRSGFYRTRPI